MDVKIGVVYTAKELIVDVDGTSDDVSAAIEAALSGSAPMLWLVDRKGRRIGVPADKLAYIEFGGEEDRKVGFGRQ